MDPRFGHAGCGKGLVAEMKPRVLDDGPSTVTESPGGRRGWVEREPVGRGRSLQQKGPEWGQWATAPRERHRGVVLDSPFFFQGPLKLATSGPGRYWRGGQVPHL